MAQEEKSVHKIQRLPGLAGLDAVTPDVDIECPEQTDCFYQLGLEIHHSGHVVAVNIDSR